MGKRLLLVEPEMLVEFCKYQAGMERTFTVAHALPDDARYVDCLYTPSGRLHLILESSGWAGHSEIPLLSPEITVHYAKAVGVEP